jgi:hypothetical protein
MAVYYHRRISIVNVVVISGAVLLIKYVLRYCPLNRQLMRIYFTIVSKPVSRGVRTKPPFYEPSRTFVCPLGVLTLAKAGYGHGKPSIF